MIRFLFFKNTDLHYLMLIATASPKRTVSMLTTRSLQFSYGNGQTFQFPDIHCTAGETLLITGSSGKGKTTLLHLLAGILRPAAGEILIDGTDIVSLKERRLDEFRGKNIGIVFQQSHFVQSLNVLDNILLASYLPGHAVNIQRAGSLLQALNLAEKIHKKPAALSQGQQQRVSIARALVNHQKLILADEPTSSLDDEHCNIVAAMLKEQAALAHAALVVVTHDQRLKSLFENIISL
jgi:putative ABC transport system ATP-binding protein